MQKIKDRLNDAAPLAKECFMQGCIAFLFMLVSSLVFSFHSLDGGMFGANMQEYSVCMLECAWISLLESAAVAVFVDRQCKN